MTACPQKNHRLPLPLNLSEISLDECRPVAVIDKDISEQVIRLVSSGDDLLIHTSRRLLRVSADIRKP
jgi:hypothetical protein